MKSSRVRALIGLAVLVALLLLSWTIFEARQQRRQVEETLTAQAAVLSQSLSPALAAASNASLEIDEMVSWRLLDNARLLAELWSHDLRDPEHLEELAESSGLDSALFLDSAGMNRLAVGEPIPAQIVEQLEEILTGRAEELVLGTSLEDGIEHLGAAAASPAGNVVLVRVHPSSARTLVQRLGVENLLASLVGSGGVLYLSYHEEQGVIAEAAWDSQGVPTPEPTDSEPFDVRGRTAIEVAMPVETQAGNQATLRVGLDGSALKRAATQAMWRSLLVGLVLTGFTVSAAGFAVVSRLRASEREAAGKSLVEAETARRRSERLAVAGALTAGMAHEVRSPMNAIGLAAQRLERKLSGHSDLQQIAGRIRIEVDRLEGVLRGFLELARPVSDRRSDNDLAAVAREVLEVLSDEAEDRGVVLDGVLGSASARTDRESIHRAILNLVRNAIQASSRGGRITVQAAQVDGRATLRVLDRGSGLDPELEGKFFDPFVTGRNTGTGLGLALVKRVAEEHGGTVTLADRDGGGAAAILSLAIDGEEET